MNELLSTDPTVVMNVELGKNLPEGQVLDVNYDALRKNFEAMGAPDDNSDLVIAVDVLHSTTDGDYTSNSRGYRTADESGPLIRVEYYADNPVATQRILQHEMRHYKDNVRADILLRLGTAASHRYFAILNLSGVAAAASLGAMYAAHDMTPGMYKDAIDTVAAGLGLASPVALVGVSLTTSLYFMHPSERRAAKAERLNLPRVLSLDEPENLPR